MKPQSAWVMRQPMARCAPGDMVCPVQAVKDLGWNGRRFGGQLKALFPNDVGPQARPQDAPSSSVLPHWPANGCALEFKVLRGFLLRCQRLAEGSQFPQARGPKGQEERGAERKVDA
jgi:hypothetical protein